MKINTFTHMLVEGSETAKKLEQMLVDALKYAASNGLVATIENTALIPLAMTNHEPTIAIAATKEYGMALETWYRNHEKKLMNGVRTIEADIEQFVRSPEIPTLVNKVEDRIKTIGEEIAQHLKEDL